MISPNQYLGSLAVALVLPLSAYSQQASVETGTLNISIDSSSAQIVTSTPASSKATCSFSEEPVFVIGDSEEDDNQFFSSIRGMGRLSDGSIAVVDRASAEVRIFDASGRHVRSMGQRGKGPSEFTDPFILWITAGDTLWVGNYRPWSYVVFTAQGQFVRRIVLDPVYPNSSNVGGVLDNGHTVNTRGGQSMSTPDFGVPDTLIVEIHDPNGKLVGNLARIPNGTSGEVREAENFYLSKLFEARAVVDALGSTIVLGHGSKPEVQVLDDENNLRMILRWPEPNREVTRADVRAWRNDYRERRSPSGWRQFDDARISRERPVADVFPAISSVRIGRDGRIWVRQYDRPREDRGWLAFGADGKFFCHMAQTPGSVWEFGADYVLLLHRSEIGVETVRMHRLTLPS